MLDLCGALRTGGSGVRVVQRSGGRIEVHQAFAPGLIRQNVQLIVAIVCPELYFVPPENLGSVVVERQITERVTFPGVFAKLISRKPQARELRRGLGLDVERIWHAKLFDVIRIVRVVVPAEPGDTPSAGEELVEEGRPESVYPRSADAHSHLGINLAAVNFIEHDLAARSVVFPPGIGHRGANVERILIAEAVIHALRRVVLLTWIADRTNPVHVDQRIDIVRRLAGDTEKELGHRADPRRIDHVRAAVMAELLARVCLQVGGKRIVYGNQPALRVPQIAEIPVAHRFGRHTVLRRGRR